MLDLVKIHEAIDAFTLRGEEESYHVHIPAKKDRGYLGMSGIGDRCLRKVWYQHRKVAETTFPPRMLRLFRTGDIYEFRFIYLLRGIGFDVFEKDENGKQFKATDFGGHFSGSMDGVGTAPAEFWLTGHEPHPFLLEFKTYSDKRFIELQKNGVKKNDIKYWKQLHAYMGYNNLKAALFIAVNKNTEELYMEWVVFDKFEFKRVVRDAEDILTTKTPPERISNISSHWECKNSKFTCDYHGICFGKQAALKTCRTCRFASPAENGEWACEKGRVFGEVCEEYKDITKA